MEEVQAQLHQLAIKLQVSEDRQRANEGKIASLSNSLNEFQVNTIPTEYHDIITTITNGDTTIIIQLDSYRSIPEFSGDKNQYRSWREQVTRRMRLIENLKTHPKYEAALGIIRAKISGIASDILINNNTAYNIDAIIDRLDFSYSDQRPLYVVESELTSLKQMNKSLQEFYDAVNQALNTVISKIVMTYKIDSEQKSLITETQQKAIRTFIMGLSSPMMRVTLYRHAPKTLAKAFAIAQTVYYDNQYLQLDRNRESQKCYVNKQQIQHKPDFKYNFENPRQKFQPKMNDKPEQMEIETSNRFKQSTNWRRPEQQTPIQKREFDGSGQHTRKMQRINHLNDDKDIPNMEHIPDDLISNTSEGTETASAFLEE